MLSFFSKSFLGETEIDSQINSCIDRKSTRLNSSHSQISYAVFCLKKKKIKIRLSHSSHAHPVVLYAYQTCIPLQMLQLLRIHLQRVTHLFHHSTQLARTPPRLTTL